MMFENSSSSEAREVVSAGAKKLGALGRDEGRRKVVWGAIITAFSICVALVSFLTGLNPTFMLLSVAIGILVAPMQVLMGFNVYFLYWSYKTAFVHGFVLRAVLFGSLFVLFGFASGLGLVLSAKYVPVSVQTFLTKYGTPFTVGSFHVVDAIIPSKLLVLIGAVMTFVGEFMISPVAVALLYSVGQLKHAGEDFDRPKKKVPGPNKKPVIVLLHGNGFNECQWLVGRFHMKTRPWYENVEIITVNYFTGPALRTKLQQHHTVAGCAEVAVEQIKTRLKERELEPEKIILMGHSLGSCTSAYIKENLAEKHGLPITHVVAWSGPLAGSDLLLWGKRNLPAWMVPTREGTIRDEFCPTHENPRKLLAKMEESVRAGRSSYFGITGFCDHLVRPNSACPPFFQKRAVLWHVGHFNIKLSSVAWKLVMDHLEEDGHVL